ncbi:hypothetical protein A2369_00470 [candidate division WS6 bacterium RIFOXYB1_FULL_33_15]|nr:MAG: hypothetical protein A2369_00470 [candidate division WS6 bacterium RIFOXYB1_FULL_33_15]
MRYFFECGNFVELSLVELSCVLESYDISKDSINRVGEGILLVESNTVTEEVLDRIFQRLGGFIRYGQVIDDIDSFLLPFLKKEKITFGISALGNTNVTLKDIQRLANEIKRGFKSNGVSSRFILPKQSELNAAQIFTNSVIENGFELCIFDTKAGRMYGSTLSIQDINAFIKRDLDRPSVDFDMGVLPQKLARMMCNFTGFKEGIIWDPFCGSGTILIEAATLGFDILGSDIDLNAIENSEKNIQWLSEEGLISHTRVKIFPLDIHSVPKKTLKEIKRTGISAIVCEPFMGPPQRKILGEGKADELLNKVRTLYESLFNIMNEISRPGFKVVLIIPSYRTKSGFKTISISSFIGKKWDVLNKKYTKGDLKWERNNSIITRNIFILSKR